MKKHLDPPIRTKPSPGARSGPGVYQMNSTPLDNSGDRRLLGLQRSIGNHAVNQWLGRSKAVVQRMYEPSDDGETKMIVPRDKQQMERQAMEEESRRRYEETLRTTGAPPKWDQMMKNPKFRQAVTSEDDRIYNEAMLERSTRRANEAAMLNSLESERTEPVVTPQPELQPPSSLDTLSQGIKNHLFSFLPGEDLLSMRTTSKANLEAVTEHAQRRVPYPDPGTFTAATTGHWPQTFAKSEYTKDEISMGENQRLGWQEYQKSGAYRERYENIDKKPPAYMERMDDNRFIFQQNMDGTRRRQELEETGRLFQPSQGKWTPQMNDAWLLGQMHSGAPLHLVSEPSPSSLYEEDEARPTQTGREVLMGLRSGYQVGSPETDDDRLVPFERGGTLLEPGPTERPPIIQDATGSDDRLRLEQFSHEQLGHFEAPSMFDSWQGPDYMQKPKEQLEHEYRMQQISGIKGKIKRMGNLAQVAFGKQNKKKDATDEIQKINKEIEEANQILRKFASPDDRALIESWINEFFKKEPLKRYIGGLNLP